jgi:large conductance mechanosensitive channel
MLKEFKEFAMKGSVIDLAVGVVLGAAFGKIVSSLVDDLLMPPIGRLIGNANFSNFYINLSGGSYASLEAAKEAGAVTLNYGAFANAVFNFLLVAFALFLLIRQVNRLRRQSPPPTPETRECPHCVTSISRRATRCPACTAPVAAAVSG